jgi:hypothetical protein
MSHLQKKLDEQNKLIKFLASKYEKDTGRKISLPSTLGQILEDPTIIGDNPMIKQEDEKFEEGVRKGRIAAETLKKPLTFFEAVEALKLPKIDESADKKDKNKKVPTFVFEPHHMMLSIDLNGFEFMRFSRAGLQELVIGIDKLPCIRAVSLKNNGINELHDKEIIALMSIVKVRSLDLSNNKIGPKLANQIGRALRDSCFHFTWIDLTQNEFYEDSVSIGIILTGLKK